MQYETLKWTSETHIETTRLHNPVSIHRNETTGDVANTDESVKVSPNRQFIALSDSHGCVKVYTMAGDLVSTYHRKRPLHGRKVYEFKWSPNCSRLAYVTSIGNMNEVVVLNPASGKRIVRYAFQMPHVRQWAPRIEWSPDGEKLGLSTNFFLKIYSATHQEKIAHINHRDDSYAGRMWWSPNSCAIAFYKRFEGLYVVPSLSGDAVDCICYTSFKRKDLRTLCWAPDSSKFAVPLFMMIDVCSATKRRVLQSFYCGREYENRYAQWSPNGKMIALTVNRGTVRVFLLSEQGKDVETLIQYRLERVHHEMRKLKWRPNGPSDIKSIEFKYFTAVHDATPYSAAWRDKVVQALEVYPGMSSDVTRIVTNLVSHAERPS